MFKESAMPRTLAFLAVIFCALAIGCRDDDSDAGWSLPPPPPPPTTPVVLFSESFDNAAIPGWRWTYPDDGLYYTSTFDGTPAPALRLGRATTSYGYTTGTICTVNYFQGRNVTYTCDIKYNPPYIAGFKLLYDGGTYITGYYIMLDQRYIYYTIMNPTDDTIRTNVSHDNAFHTYKISIDAAGTVKMYRDNYLIRTAPGIPDAPLRIRLLGSSDSWFDSIKVTTP